MLKVDGFLNHQMDVALFAAMGEEWARLFAGEGVNKILTIEAPDIGIACIAAQRLGVRVESPARIRAMPPGQIEFC